MSETILPKGNRLLVQRIEASKTTGEMGIILLPDAAKEKPKEGTVIELGDKFPCPHCKKEIGFTADNLEPGDRIMFTPKAGTPLNEDEDLLIINYTDIICIVRVTDDGN